MVGGRVPARLLRVQEERGSAMKNHQPTTHERYLHAVRDVVIARAVERGTITAEQAERLAHTKLLYGVGDGTYRGVTVFDAWENGVGRVDIVELAATGQESWIQLAGTVIHEPLTALDPAAGGGIRAAAWCSTDSSASCGVPGVARQTAVRPPRCRVSGSGRTVGSRWSAGGSRRSGFSWGGPPAGTQSSPWRRPPRRHDDREGTRAHRRWRAQDRA